VGAILERLQGQAELAAVAVARRQQEVGVRGIRALRVALDQRVPVLAGRDGRSRRVLQAGLLHEHVVGEEGIAGDPGGVEGDRLRALAGRFVQPGLQQVQPVAPVGRRIGLPQGIHLSQRLRPAAGLDVRFHFGNADGCAERQRPRAHQESERDQTIYPGAGLRCLHRCFGGPGARGRPPGVNRLLYRNRPFRQAVFADGGCVTMTGKADLTTVIRPGAGRGGAGGMLNHEPDDRPAIAAFER